MLNMTPKSIIKFWSKVNKRPDGVWEWTGTRLKFGHGHFYYLGFYTLAHRISWELANGPIPTGMCVLHKNDIPYDVNPDNLFLGTKNDNNKDRHKKHRTKLPNNQGSKNGQAKLSENQVRAIRYWWATGLFTQKQIGMSFGVQTKTISKILTNKRWQHVENKV